MNISPWFHRYAIVAVGWAVLLVWWGAAVTTKGVGMAVPDWPLSFGSVNPDGWWNMPGVRLEHGHRILGAVMGILVVGLVAWAWLGKASALVRNLSVVALVAVIIQGVLGGLRVTEISNSFAVFHGCFAQAFFCLLIFIVMLSSPRWGERTRETLEAGALQSLRKRSFVFVAAVYCQLILGATMRHTHRGGLADDGILTTGGKLFPGFGDFDLAILFSHKAWALVVLAASLAVTDLAKRKLSGHEALRRHAFSMTGLVAIQILFGVSVIFTGKGFWITNFHVFTGLMILAGAFMLAVKAFAARSVAAEAGETEETRNGLAKAESGSGL